MREEKDTTCPYCEGSGFDGEDECTACNGCGWYGTDRQLTEIIKRLEAENAELKAEIERRKKCYNCCEDCDCCELQKWNKVGF